MAIIKKKGFFFSTDAILALGVFVIAIILIIQLRPTTLPEYDSTILADDVMIALSTIKVNESQSPTIKDMITNQNITSQQLDLSIAEYVSELWSENRTSLAEQILEEIMAPLSTRLQVSFSVNQDDIYEFENQDSLRTIAKSSRLVSGINKSQPSRGYSANLFFTSAGKRSTSDYVYFDGLTGMGDITRIMFLPDNAEVYRVLIEVNAPSEFELWINTHQCGIYVPTVGATIRADTFEVEETAICNFSTIFLDGQNDIEVRFTTSNPQQKYISGGYIRIFYTSENENTHLINYHDGLVTERVYFNGVDELINIFSGFYFPGNITEMNIQLHFDNQAPEDNRFYLRISDKIVYNTADTGVILINITNATLSSYLLYENISGVTVPLRMGHLESNTTNVSGGSADAMVTIQTSQSMDTCDFPYNESFTSDCEEPNSITRLLASRIATEALAIQFMNGTDNRMGVVPYHTTPPPGRVLGLTGNLPTVINHIWGNLGSTPPVCFTCAIVTAGTELKTNSNPSKRRAILLMSDGYTNRCYYGNPNCNPLGGLTVEQKALQESITEACSMWDQDKITIFTVGYGLGADHEGLRNISEGCTDGLHFEAQNLTELIDVYINISTQIQSLNYQEQIPVIEGDISSILFPDSFIEATYIPYYQEQFGLLTIRGETPKFTSQGTVGSFSVNNPDMIRDASVLSYSADKWTEYITINGNTFYNISDYGENYTMIGDPFRISIPKDLITSGNNAFLLSLTNISYASEDNKVTYTAYINNSVNAYSTVVSKAEGCNWHVEQEDGNVFEISIPSSYSGSKTCSYQNATYDSDDAYDISAYALLSQLDIDNNGLIDVYLTDQDLTIESSIIENVPSLWGPALFEVRVGR